MMQNFKRQIGINDEYIEEKIRLIDEQKMQKIKAKLQQKRLREKMKEARTKQLKTEGVNADINEVLSKEQYKELRQKDMMLKEKKEITKVIMQKALREMRERYKQLIKQAFVAYCVKVYYQSGKNFYELVQIERERNLFLKNQSSVNLPLSGL